MSFDFDLHPRLDLFLADYAQVMNGKLTMVGGGWNQTRAGAPFSICGFVYLPWSSEDSVVEIELNLLDLDFLPVTPPGQSQPAMVTLNAHVQVGAGEERHNEQIMPFAVGFMPMPLEPGEYLWQAKLNGREHGDWRLPFYVAA